MSNTRFATAIHIMTILGKEPNNWFTSDLIAGSININPVIVRKEIAYLKKNGLIESRKGKEGGLRIAKNPSSIFLDEIFVAVKSSDFLGKKNQAPNPRCIIGKNINKNIGLIFDETEQMVIDLMKNKNLKDFIEKF